MPLFLKIVLIVFFCLFLACKPNLSDSDDDDDSGDDDDQGDDDSSQECSVDFICEYQLEGCNFLDWQTLASCKADTLDICGGDDEAMVECFCQCIAEWPCSEMPNCEYDCRLAAGC